MFRRTLAVLGLLLVFAGPTTAQAPLRYDDAEIYSLDHDGARRLFAIYAPRSLPQDQAAPLIVALHGRYSSAKAMHAMAGLAAVADAHGAVLVYPQALGGFWNDGGHELIGRSETPTDDVGFIEALVEELSRARAIDRSRIYIVGYDNGALLGHRLACQSNLRPAGFVAVGALMWSFAPQTCAAVPTLIVHGRRDPVYEINGGPASEQANAPTRFGVAETIAYWRGINGCGGSAEATARGGSVSYRSCTGAPFAYVGVDRGGREWFGGEDGQRLNRFGVSATALVEQFLFDQPTFALPRGAVTAATARNSIVYVPPGYDASRPTPVIVALHGRPGTGAGMASLTRLNAVADRHNFIVVYPDGLRNEWNSVGDLVGLEADYPQDDVRFLGDLVDDLRLDLNIDPNRQYITGFSNGAIMTYRMACSASDKFAAFAPVGGALYYDVRDACRGGTPRPIAIFHGSADASVPYDGVVSRRNNEMMQVSTSVPDSIAYFVRRNGCSEVSQRTDIPQSGASPGAQVIRFDQADCDNGADVRFYLINGGGHQWPGVNDVLTSPHFGVATMDINAGEEMWDFFSRHSLADRR
jgi:polyhydroxybutyrate depolymerase